MRNISIHAPLRERLSELEYAVTAAVFQSTLPCGSDISISLAINFDVLFQSTLPCGSDVLYSLFAQMSKNFNPRSLAGATDLNRLLQILITFQSTLPCGSDQPDALVSVALDYFNPRSLAGATVLLYLLFFLGLTFQSTLPCGSDYQRQKRTS